MVDVDVCLSLTDGGEVCCHKISSLWHDGLQTHTLQQRGQFVLLVMQHGWQLLEVALWSPKHLVLSLKPSSYSFLLKFRMQRRNCHIHNASVGHISEMFKIAVVCQQKKDYMYYVLCHYVQPITARIKHKSYLSRSSTVVNRVLMDGFHVFYDMPRADGPANLHRK